MSGHTPWAEIRHKADDEEVEQHRQELFLAEELHDLRERLAIKETAEADGRVVDRGQWLHSMEQLRRQIADLEARIGAS